MAPLSLTTTGGSNGASSTGSPAAGTVGGIGLTERTLGHLSHHLAGSTGSGSFTDHMVNPSLTNLGNLEASVTESASAASLPPFLRNLVTGNLTAAAAAVANSGSLASVTTTGTVGGGGSRQFSNASPPSHRSQSPNRNSLGGGSNLQGSPFVSLSHSSSSSSKRRKYSLDQEIEQEDRDESRWRRRPRYPQHLISANATAYDDEEGHYEDEEEEIDDEDDMDEDSLEQVQDLSTRRSSSHSRLLTTNITNSSLATTLHRGISDPGTLGGFRRNKGDQSANGKSNNDRFGSNGGDDEFQGNDEENAIACSTDSFDDGNSGDQNEDRVNKFTPCLDEDGHGNIDGRVASCDDQVTSNNKLQANSKDIQVDSNNSAASSNVASNEASHEKSVNANANGLLGSGNDEDKNLLFSATIDGDNKNKSTIEETVNANAAVIDLDAEAVTDVDDDGQNGIIGDDEDDQCDDVGDDEDEDASSNNATTNAACVTTNIARNRRRSKRGRKKFTHDKK